MSIIEKLVKIINEGDTNGAKEVMHDDFKFLMHSSGKTLSKDDVVKWVGMKDVKLDKHRILFENIKAKLKVPNYDNSAMDGYALNFKDIKNKSHMYFVHSYEFIPEDESTKLSFVNYGKEIIVGVNKGKYYGVQFHPEKSQRVGMKLLRNFTNI